MFSFVSPPPIIHHVVIVHDDVGVGRSLCPCSWCDLDGSGVDVDFSFK
jgi:hypothetical protein